MTSPVVQNLESVIFGAIDLQKLVVGIVEKVGEPALQEVAAKNVIAASAIPLILAALNPAIESAIAAEVAALKAKLGIA